jgi:hypothetical protein
MSHKVTEDEAIHPDRVAEVSKGKVGHAVGKVSEALQRRKAEQPIGRAGNDDRRAEPYPARGIKERGAIPRADSAEAGRPVPPMPIKKTKILD